MSDIVERLKRGESCLKGSGQTCISMNAVNGCLCAIAADEITRLAAEVERLRSLTVVQESLIRKSEAANEKLRAALDVLQAAMTAKKPIPLALKKAIIEARAALTGDKHDS